MTDVLIPIVLMGLCFLFEYGMLELAGSHKGNIWKWAIYIGMTGSLLSPFGFIRASLNPYPWHTFVGATAVMLGLIVVSYYRHFVSDMYSPAQRTAAFVKRHELVRDMSVGLAFLMILTLVIGFMQGQKRGQDLQFDIVTVVKGVQRELVQMHAEIRTNSEFREKQVAKYQRDSVKAYRDSVFRVQSLDNQKKLLQNQAEVKKALKVTETKAARPTVIFVPQPRPVNNTTLQLPEVKPYAPPKLDKRGRRVSEVEQDVEEGPFALKGLADQP